MNITVNKRLAQSKGARKARLKQGYVPGAIYGKGVEPVLIEVPARAVADVLLTATALNTVLDLKIEGESGKHSVLIDNLERDRLTRGFIHVGFHQVKKGDKVTAQIPLNFLGTPRDVALNGALLEQFLDHITVHAEPANLPAHIDVDVSGLKLGDVLSVADLLHPAGVEFTTADDIAVAAVHASSVAQEVLAADEATAEHLAEIGTVPHGEDAVTELRADADQNSDTVTGTASV